MGVRKQLKKQVLKAGQKAVEVLMADEDRARVIAKAIGRVEQGKQAVEQGQEQLLRAMQLATRSEYKQVGKQLAGLKRRLRSLDKRLGHVDTER